MIFYILIGIAGWIAMTFLAMFFQAITFNVEMFSDGTILSSLLFWWLIIPISLGVCIVKLIAYPFRKTWWE